MKFLYDFPDRIKIDRAEFFKLNPIPLPRPFKDGTGGIRKASLFGDWIRLYDEDGNYGEGPCTDLLLNFYVPILLEQPAMTLNELREMLYWRIRNFGYQSFHVRELGSLDYVLLDLLSKKHNQPMHRFLGAKKDFANVYKGGGSVLLTTEELVEDILRFKSEGYHQTKIKVAGYEDWHRDLERVKAIREAVGEDFGIAVDANQGWDVETAFQFAEAAVPYHISWLEEPVSAFDMTALKELTDRLDKAGISTDIAMGESVRNYNEYIMYAEHGVRHLQPVNAGMPFIDDIFRVKQYADEHHLMLSSGGITFSNVVLGAVYSEGQLIEYHQPIMEVIQPYLSVCSRIEDGKFYLPDVPGLPMQLDFEKLKRDGLINSVTYRYRNK